MGDIAEKKRIIFKAADVFLKWKRCSPLRKLLCLTIVTSIISTFMEQWGLLIVLISCIIGLVFLTERSLTTGMIGSPDPLAHLLGGLEQLREMLALSYYRLFNVTRITESRKLRIRSESIASSHIPDLDVEMDTSGSGSTFHKKIRLELNSIVLLIIRDFVQFWYHKFSYNSQFLKDSRQFLFRGLHNLAERVARLGPHQTSAKFLDAYREHLSTFQTARGLLQDQEQHQRNKTTIPIKMKKFESVDEAFHSKCQVHSALKTKETEKQYLRSLTKIILLCSCTHDIVTAQSTQLFLIEILAINVLMPVVEMLSTPDRLYEILIKLTYSDNDAILNENTMKELIDLEVKRMQLKKAPYLHELKLQNVHDTCVENTESSRNLVGEAELLGQKSQQQQPEKSVEIAILAQSAITSNKLKSCDKSNKIRSQDDSSKSPSKDSPEMKAAIKSDDSNISNILNTRGIMEAHDLSGGVSETKKESRTTDTDSTKMFKQSDETQGKLENNSFTSEEAADEVPADETCRQMVADNISAENIHLYGEMVATTVPLVKPKLQAFKDLFKTKKSKQQEENKQDSLDKDKRAQAETNVKSMGDIIFPTQKLKSLRLSPLLSRTNRLSASSISDSSAIVSQKSQEAVAGQKSSEKEQTPSPLPTLSPNQPGKGGPLSLFRFRKPSLDFRKSSSPSAEDKNIRSSPTQTSAVSSQEVANIQSSITVPSVRVTNENGNDQVQKELTVENGVASSSEDLNSFNISTYEEVTASERVVTKQDQKSRLFLNFGEEVEEVEEAEEGDEAERLHDESVATPHDSSLIFQDISIPSTMICQEFRSSAQFTIYQIEYEALHFSETGNPVLKTGTAKRRYREFINLMSRLEDNSAYKKLLKTVKGPKRWMTLPFKNMDKESVASRQKALEQFLKSLIEVEAICNGPEMREFLAYEGDSHIAFVKKATEINVPRIDKMLARTVSGVFDRLKSLPNLPQEMISGIRGRDFPVEQKDSPGTETDMDYLNVDTSFSANMALENMLRVVSEKYIHDIQTQGHPKAVPSSPTSQLLKDVSPTLSQEILLQVPGVEGDGAETPDDETETGDRAGEGLPRSGQLVLFEAVIDLVTQLLADQNHWLCHERVITALRNWLGPTLDRKLKDSVSDLTKDERCLYYIRLLRETIWPGGQFFSSKRAEKTEEERIATRNVAKRLLLNCCPGIIWMVVGADSFESSVEQVLESVQYTQLNKHFLYTALDMLLESLFPEILDPEFQRRLLI